MPAQRRVAGPEQVGLRSDLTRQHGCIAGAFGVAPTARRRDEVALVVVEGRAQWPVEQLDRFVEQRAAQQAGDGLTRLVPHPMCTPNPTSDQQVAALPVDPLAQGRPRREQRLVAQRDRVAFDGEESTDHERVEHVADDLGGCESVERGPCRASPGRGRSAPELDELEEQLAADLVQLGREPGEGVVGGLLQRVAESTGRLVVGQPDRVARRALGEVEQHV